jgi:uncharacterized protein with HEPN domain
MAGLRDVLIHQYQNASSERVFKVSKNNIPALVTDIAKIIDELESH